MVHPQAFRAVVDGKHRVSRPDPTAAIFVKARPLLFAAVAFFIALIPGSASHAQSGAFTGMAGNWSGGGTITLDDGSSERIRCRATYAVRVDGNGLNQTLTCASDSYKFNLASNVIAQGKSLSGTWSEATRNVSGNLEGRGSAGSFQVVASAATFTANIALTTRGNKQTVVIRSEGAFRVTSISLTRI
ncbi:hypothetical protein [Bradyrhizobium sp.]|uniref:hypothetical protein n=1 Tax=Bradyrhizobium sp. TaxID=376 RepID=UPI0025BF4E1C|nr:hypothetical protein [Bradyrhizobium sp.]